MENVEVARILNEYADLLEIRGDNTFRVRSYRKAAQTIRSLSRPVAQLAQDDGGLESLSGVGARMADHVKEILQSGTLVGLAEIQKELPATLAELVELRGLGPRKAKLLYERLGLTSIADLANAIEAGKVQGLPGFGKKTAENIQRSIRTHEQQARRFRLADADQLVRPVLEYLRRAPGISHCEVAGSYRRRRETVGDVDILVTSSKPKAVMERFRRTPQVAHVEAAGETMGTIVLQSGLQVDVRVLPRESYGAALHYFTGSKAHNVAIRRLGIERGLRISEYGVFRVPKGKTAEEAREREGKRIGGATEEEVYAAVEMVWVPPELREDRGELEAARKGRLPHLVNLEDIRGDLQMHSTWSDGHNSIEEMVRACKERGYQYCAVTDHSRAARVAGGLDAKALRRQRDEIEAVRERVSGITVLAAVEVDILADGSLDLADDILAELDLVVASVHSRLDMPEGRMTKRVLKALAHPLVDILAHPTGRQIGTREPAAFDLEAVCGAAKEHDVALELNGQPERLDLSDVHVQRARDLGVWIAINTDAHSTDTLRYMRYGVDQARRGWLEKTDVLNTRTAAQLRRWVRRRRS